LIPVAGTPLGKSPQVEGIELVRTIATARLLMPKSAVRLTAGRTEMSDELQALCFFAGANSVFIGDKLLTEENPQREKDKVLFKKLGLMAPMDDSAASSKDDEAKKSLRPSIKSLNASIEEVES
jgi:biotin synthase